MNEDKEGGYTSNLIMVTPRNGSDDFLFDTFVLFNVFYRHEHFW